MLFVNKPRKHFSQEPAGKNRDTEKQANKKPTWLLLTYHEKKEISNNILKSFVSTVSPVPVKRASKVSTLF